MEKQPLYRKVNTRTRGVSHKVHPPYARQRHSKALAAKEQQRGSMHSGLRLGLDYTPLFRFLLSRVGEPWDAVFSEDEHERTDYVRIGHFSFFSGLYVDAEGRLQMVDPQLRAANMSPDCPCCTHTLNGVPFGQPYCRP
ncbi:hypothetical protein AO265_21005 [Pseudomonas sp. ABAC61]|nr:hypothetical protein AO265_21005 [Pseudomonas sp. ABAC61]